MDFVSWLLALIGISSDRAMHKSDRRAEVVRLNAEVTAEAGRTLDIINAAMPRLTRRCQQICGDNPAGMEKVLNDQRSAAIAIMKMAEELTETASNHKGFIDWDQALHKSLQWRANASRMSPYVQDIVTRYDTVLNRTGFAGGSNF